MVGAGGHLSLFPGCGTVYQPPTLSAAAYMDGYFPPWQQVIIHQVPPLKISQIDGTYLNKPFTSFKQDLDGATVGAGQHTLVVAILNGESEVERTIKIDTEARHHYGLAATRGRMVAFEITLLDLTKSVQNRVEVKRWQNWLRLCT